jgi:hypothetical protein
MYRENTPGFSAPTGNGRTDFDLLDQMRISGSLDRPNENRSTPLR